MIQLFKICSVVFLLIITIPTPLSAQNDTCIKVTPLILLDSSVKKNIRNIIVSGNKITKDYLILREIPFKVNDSIAPKDFEKKIEQARQLIYNTTLFNEVKLTAQLVTDKDVDILVEVKERWYIYPIPQFQLADRNLNEWIEKHNADLHRVVYGVKFIDYNLSGRRDQLRIYLLNGYSKNISFSYTAPYSNSNLTEGFSIAGGFSQGREMAYKTDYNNNLLLFKQDDYVRRHWFASAGYILKRGYFVRHFFSASYWHYTISDSILKNNYNPYYFKEPVSEIGFPEFLYTMQYTNVDNATYPLKGKTGYLSVVKRGVSFSKGTDMLSFEGGANRYWNLGKKWYGSAQFNAKIKLPFDQAYINQRAFGYGENYLRGLEYYVVDGVMTALLRSTIKRKILYFSLPFPIKLKSHPRIPVTIFAKSYADIGYAYNKKQFDTFLNNRLLYTGGLGIDIFSLYDASLRIEYSFNQLRQKGLFLHVQSAF